MSTERQKGERVTTEEGKGLFGIPLKPSHFVSEPEPCESRRMHVSAPIIPRHLMTREAADRAQAALDACLDIVGTWGVQRRDQRDSPEFIAAASAFKEATGVDVSAVFELALNRYTGRA